MADLTIVVQPQVTVGVVVTPPTAPPMTLGLQGLTGASGVANIQWNETPAGTLNGVNQTFTLTHAPIGAIVSLNGLIQNPGTANDYTISSNTLTFNIAPFIGDILVITYTH